MGKPLRILQIANQPGPLYLFMPPLCQVLREAGAEIEFACMPIGALWEPLKQSESMVHDLPVGSWKNPLTWLRLYHRLRALFRSGKFDLMIVHTPAMSWVARVAAKGLIPVTIYFAHGLAFAPLQSKPAHLFFRWIEKFMARYTDGVLVVNSDDAAACREVKLTRTGGHCYHVPGPGVDANVIAVAPLQERIAELEAELGLAAGRPLVLFLARFIPTKRPGDVLELAKRIGPRVDFVLAGEGPLWKSIKEQADMVGPHVKVIEFSQRVPLLLARCSVFVLPSVFREGLPQTLLETLAAGKPAVAYDVRGPRDIIDHGKTGFLVPPYDIDALHESVKKILEDEKLRQEMGRAAGHRFDEKFSLDASLSAITGAIREVLLQRGICDLRIKG